MQVNNTVAFSKQEKCLKRFKALKDGKDTSTHTITKIILTFELASELDTKMLMTIIITRA